MPSSSEARPPLKGEALKVRLVWLTVFRTVVTVVLLLFIGARRLSGPVAELSSVDTATFAVIGGVFALTVLYALALRGSQASPLAAYGQLLGDVVVASGLIFLTGALESPFTFTYSVAVIAAATVVGQRGALWFAAVSVVAFASLGLLVQVGVLAPPSGGQTLTPARFFFVLASNAAAQLFVAVLAGQLARQVAAAGGQVRQQEAQIQKLVGLQNEIVSAMPSGLLTFNGDGTVTFMNPAARAILGLPAGGQPPAVTALFPGLSRLSAEARRAELTIPTPQGQRVLGLAVTHLAAPVESTLVVFQDLTELRRAESLLQKSDHLASLGTLSAQLAHEIRNPLASMRGAAQLLADEVSASSSGVRLSGILLRESDRLAKLVDDFLRFARPPPPVLTRLDLGALVHETAELLRVDPLAQGVSLESPLAHVDGVGDAALLRQVLLNLLRNALQAARPGGRVKAWAAAAPSHGELHVWDSAGKIPPADLQRLFEPFFTTHEGGTGLGLSTAHSIVRAHGGEILVTSSPERGTEFVVVLPRSPATIAAA